MHLFVAIAISALALQATPQKPSIQNGAPAKHKQTGTPKPKIESAPSVAASSPPCADQPTSKEANQQTIPSDRTYSVKIVSQPPDYWNRAYVIITGLLATVGILTLRSLYRQTNAAHNAERGRIDIIFELMGGGLFQFNVNNSGRSEVRILEWKLYRQVGDTDMRYHPPSIISYPFRQEAMNSILHKEKGTIMEMIDSIDIFPIEAQELRKIAYLTGTVKYVDIFDRKHATRVAYRTDGSSIVFLPEYAKYK